jgi:hypothetical protein
MKADVTQIPTSSDQSATWLLWFKSLQSEFGNQTACMLFLKAWKTRGGEKQNSADLRAYLSKYGVDIDKSIWDATVDLGEGVVDKISGFMSIGKYAIYAVGGILVLGLAGMVFQIVRKPETLGTIAKVAAI